MPQIADVRTELTPRCALWSETNATRLRVMADVPRGRGGLRRSAWIRLAPNLRRLDTHHAVRDSHASRASTSITMLSDPSSRRFFRTVILIAALDRVSFAFSGIPL